MTKRFLFPMSMLYFVVALAAQETLPPKSGNGLIEVNGQRRNLALDPRGDFTCRAQFAQAVERAAGVKLDIDRPVDPAFDNYVIRFMTPAETQATEYGAPERFYHYYLRCPDGKNLTIGGYVRYGMHDFMKRFMGHRQFGGMAEEDVLPERTHWVLPETIDFDEKPAIPSYLAVGAPNRYFARTERLTSRGTHAFWQAVPPGEYGETNPEFFPLIDGKRRIPKPNVHSGWQPCVSAPGLVDAVLKYADAYFAENPRMASLPLGVNDAAGDCLCASCAALFDRHGNQYADFYNRVARALAERHPRKTLAFIAYGRKSLTPPRDLAMEPNILVEINGPDLPALRAWKAAGVRHFGVYDYLYTAGNGYVAPRHFPRAQVARWREINGEFGLTALFCEYSPHETVVEGARQYVLDEAAWNLDVDVDALLADYFAGMFGESATPVAAFFDRLEAVAVRDPEWHAPLRGWRNPDQLRWYTREDLSYLDGRLEEARGLARTEGTRSRLERLEAFYALFRPYVELSLSARAISAGDPDSDGAVDELLREVDGGYRALRAILDFRFADGMERRVFYEKYGHLDAFRAQYNLLPRPILERAVDPALSRVSVHLARTKPDDAKRREDFWRERAARTENPELKAIFLTQLYRDPENREYMVNGDFVINGGKGESAPPGWNVWRSSREEVDIHWDATEKRAGSHAAAIGKNANDGIVFSRGMALKSGCRYRVSCSVKRRGDSEKGLRGTVSIRQDGSNGTWLAYAAVPPEADGEWTRLEFVFTFPEGAKRAVFAISPPRQGEDSRLWVDQVSLKKIYDPAAFE